MIRFYEMLPGMLSWGTLSVLLVFSWQLPAVVAIFIVLFDLYWFLKTVYLFFHLRYSFVRMKRELARDWAGALETLDREGIAWAASRDIYHLVILPMYQEPLPLVRETVRSLARTRHFKDRLFVVVALEERGGAGDRATAEAVAREFGHVFAGFHITRHPANLEGELMGKGSNETWAAKEAVKVLIEARGITKDHVMVSVFDIDTRPGPDYFGVLTYRFLTEPKAQRASYQPVPLFTNNIHHVPVFTRLIAFTTTFWNFMQQSRHEQLVTFSSHSIPLRALSEVGFWHTNIVSEDSRIFFQCFAHYGGDWRVVPLYYPVTMDAVEGESFWKALGNLYKQQRRWAWGVENVPYVLGEFGKHRGLSFRTKFFWGFNLVEGFYTWATSSFIIFFFGWFPLILGGREFNATVLSYNLPVVTGILINLSMLGIIALAAVSATLLSPRLTWERENAWTTVSYIAQWFLLPLTLLVFSGVPALDAQTRMMLGGKYRLGFWRTPKLEEKP
ncbi:MAG: glycosyltransferase family 2 protein [Candidatus Jorgensenbacteria bacterium]|nr:glycosyltransferase family 2 protein [Candidatus Jorgensenbacteria bacterium]